MPRNSPGEAWVRQIVSHQAALLRMACPVRASIIVRASDYHLRRYDQRRRCWRYCPGIRICKKLHSTTESTKANCYMLISVTQYGTAIHTATVTNDTIYLNGSRNDYNTSGAICILNRDCRF